MISLARADDRLVHGLVAVSWTNQIKPDILLVANDKAASDPTMKMTMKMAKPAGVILGIKNLKDSIVILNNPKYINKKIFLVTKNVKDIYQLSESVKNIETVDIGTAGIEYHDNAIAVLPQVKMTNEEFEFAKKLNSKGVEVFAQVSPTQEKLSFKGIENKF